MRARAAERERLKRLVRLRGQPGACGSCDAVEGVGGGWRGSLRAGQQGRPAAMRAEMARERSTAAALSSHVVRGPGLVLGAAGSARAPHGLPVRRRSGTSSSARGRSGLLGRCGAWTSFSGCGRRCGPGRWCGAARQWEQHSPRPGRTGHGKPHAVRQQALNALHKPGGGLLVAPLSLACPLHPTHSPFTHNALPSLILPLLQVQAAHAHRALYRNQYEGPRDPRAGFHTAHGHSPQALRVRPPAPALRAPDGLATRLAARLATAAQLPSSPQLRPPPCSTTQRCVPYSPRPPPESHDCPRVCVSHVP
jgi:hypothetical protein